ncbi:Hypothetical_protein [Hexamita inflata]|uniref:Hypothetical_protein n=1 Tax=Hexamita inflata TaxID=28002 RepID=A0AA86PS66_9EUKA|nr:Hypothetical protein HINF_LOCUS31436 [Hexamita inflata]CAI9943792.1 Hypothetical protein HINF_LOCUS31437 [Hexamita inflata]
MKYSNATIYHVAISQQSNSNILTNILSSSTKQLQLGGLVSLLDNSKIKLFGIQYIRSDTMNAQYMQYNGLIIGLSFGNLCKMQITHININYCITLPRISFTNQFGLIGSVDGQLQMQECEYNLNISNGTFNYLGFIGQITALSTEAHIKNIQIQMIMNDSQGSRQSTLVGNQCSQTWSLEKIQVNNSQLYGNYYIGYICGYAQSSGTINEIIVHSSKICIEATGHAYAGSIIGYIINSKNTTIFGIQISGINISASSEQIDPHIGLIIGEQQINSNLTIVDSVTVNSNLQAIALFNTSYNGTMKSSYIGGFVGISYSNLVIQNSQQQNISLNGSAQRNVFSGGVLGFSSSLTNIQFSQIHQKWFFMNTNCKIIAFSGGIIGQAGNTVSINQIQIENYEISCFSSNSTCKLTLNFVKPLIELKDSQSLGINIIDGITLSNCIFTDLENQNGC